MLAYELITQSIGAAMHTVGACMGVSVEMFLPSMIMTFPYLEVCALVVYPSGPRSFANCHIEARIYGPVPSIRMPLFREFRTIVSDTDGYIYIYIYTLCIIIHIC